jgi:hypothetical protein
VKQICAAVILFGTFGAAAPLNADEPISVAVNPAVTMARGSANLRVFVERNDSNRTLTWEIDGPDYYRSSTTQLEGAAAPRSWFFLVRDLPQGEFDIRATVTRNNNSQAVAKTRIIVMGMRSEN